MTLKKKTHRAWDSSIESLLFGLEQEYFIFKEERPPTLLEMDCFFISLHKYGFSTFSKSEDNRIKTVRKYFDEGYVCISNDFCTHIIEASFPPIKDIQKLESYFTETWNIVTQALAEQGIAIIKKATLQNIDFETVFIQHLRKDWYDRRLKPADAGPLWDRYLTTLMCSTQIHLNIKSSVIFTKLRYFYAKEYLIPLLYSNSFEILGHKNYCSRLILWLENSPEKYPAWGIPNPIPNTEQDYELMLDSCGNFCRDYTFISARDFGTIEFRSSCAQENFEQISEIIALRVGILILSTVNSEQCLKKDNDLISHFYDVCRFGRFDQNLLVEDHLNLVSIKNLIPTELLPSYERALCKMQLLFS